MVFNSTVFQLYQAISFIGEIHRPVASHLQTLSRNVVRVHLATNGNRPHKLKWNYLYYIKC